MAARRQSSSSDGGGLIAGGIGLCIVIGLLYTLVMWMISTWYIWVGLAAFITLVVIIVRTNARDEPLKVEVERGPTEVIFNIKRRTGAQPWPAEAARHEGAVKRDDNTYSVAFYDPKIHDEEQLALCMDEAQDIAAWWTYRMKGGADDVDRALVVANKLAQRNIATRKPGTPA